MKGFVVPARLEGRSRAPSPHGARLLRLQAGNTREQDSREAHVPHRQPIMTGRRLPRTPDRSDIASRRRGSAGPDSRTHGVTKVGSRTRAQNRTRSDHRSNSVGPREAACSVRYLVTSIQATQSGLCGIFQGPGPPPAPAHTLSPGSHHQAPPCTPDTVTPSTAPLPDLARIGSPTRARAR